MFWQVRDSSHYRVPHFGSKWRQSCLVSVKNETKGLSIWREGGLEPDSKDIVYYNYNKKIDVLRTWIFQKVFAVHGSSKKRTNLSPLNFESNCASQTKWLIKEGFWIWSTAQSHRGRVQTSNEWSFPLKGTLIVDLLNWNISWICEVKQKIETYSRVSTTPRHVQSIVYNLPDFWEWTIRGTVQHVESV